MSIEHEYQDRSLFYIVLFVLASHFFGLLFAHFDSNQSKKVMPEVKRLVVQTVALQPKVHEPEPILIAAEEPIPVVKEAPPKEEPPVIEAKEEPPVIEAKEEPPVANVKEVEPEPVPPPKEEKPKPVEEKPKPKPIAKKPPAKKKVEVKKPVKKKEVAKKTPEKKKTVAKKPETKKVDPKIEAAKTKRKNLLEQAQKSIAKIEQNRDKVSANRPSIVAEANVPAPIESLHVEALVGDGTQTFTKQEIGYNDELAGRLKLLLRLPEFGEVKIKLTLKRSGQFVKAVIVSSESSTNKKYVEKTLPTLSYPGFGNNFGTVPEYTFVIVLSNDL